MNILNILRYQTKKQPDKVGYIYLQDGENKVISLTYGELEKRARSIAANLQTMTRTSDRTLLVYPPGLEFISAFFGCLYAGVIAVPVYPPGGKRNLSRLLAIAKDAQSTIVLTTEIVLNRKNRWENNSTLDQMHWVATDKIATDFASDYKPIQIPPNNLALLQYTSGSTGAPKGVMVTHGNLMYNSEMIRTAFNKHDEKTIFVGWLPLFHDMGLIANILQPMYIGVPSILMSPVAFLQKPLRWLRAISKYKATTSGAPNFAYDLCVDQITFEERSKLDLSSWEIAFNGAEPVRAETIERFSEYFAEAGFRKKTFYPCYGMAENTLIISGGNKQELPIINKFQASAIAKNKAIIANDNDEDAIILVSSGQSVKGQKIAIVNSNTLTRCADSEIGEIWVAGESVAKGYWQKEKKTSNIFKAYLLDTNEGPFLRTGDLGFLIDGELFVTGRLKDLIIVCGRNYYPQDIEFTVQNSHISLKLGRGAAFAVDVKNKKELVIVQEIKRKYLKELNIKEVINNIRNNVAFEYGIEIYKIAIIKPASIPLTSSGKIQRYLCQMKFLNNELKLIDNLVI